MYRIHKWMKPTRRALITFLPPLNNKRLALDIRWTPASKQTMSSLFGNMTGDRELGPRSPLVKFIVRISREAEKELVIN